LPTKGKDWFLALSLVLRKDKMTTRELRYALFNQDQDSEVVVKMLNADNKVSTFTIVEVEHDGEVVIFVKNMKEPD
jgi:hypothetical protein